MISKVDKLAVLCKRPFWAMLQSEAQRILTRVILEFQGKPEPEDAGAEAAEWTVRHAAAKIVGEQFQSSAPTGTKVCVIPILGPLSLDSDVVWYGGTTYGSIQDSIAQAAADPNVREIILLVDSPGGEVTGLPETADAIYRAAQDKPVTAMVTGMAASAAYYLTSQANHVMLTPSGSVGSVGVIMLHADVSKLLADMGVNVTAIFAGQYKTEFWPFFPLTDEAKASAQTQIDGLYQGFLDAVKRGRGGRATKAGIDSNFGDGRMLDAGEAVAAGMVDMVANVRDAFKSRVGKMRTAARARELETI